ncbi:GDSL esterase/lipase At5g45950 [Morus notabilis]|uniref:GDSL esterase/lipase At5g45950 n=1 Tax=Morus notabilis TaxID=981085 RepID=UPI000CECFAA6|nr:GDSL esterase/lipase At5g45950 [Morus notabilis]
MMKVSVLVMVVTTLVLVQAVVLRAHVNVGQIRQLAARNNVSCVLVFGDSSVDPGNNNVLQTTMKGNFPPYGKDFFGRRPTGRFSDGRLATDFIADTIGYHKIIPGFLDPHLKVANMVHGVSFASAASGYDDYTANISNVLPLSAQLKYFMHYKVKVRRLLGEKRADDIIRNAIFVLSMGTNDFLQNYYLDPFRPSQYTLNEYQNFLVSRMADNIKEMHRLGARRLVVVGVPPLGCMPLVKTLQDQTTCVESYNKLSLSFNSKISFKLSSIKSTLRMKVGFVDVYGIVVNAMNNPHKYGLTETSKGCCGTGTIEYGDSCRGMATCNDPTKYVFWDAVHPTEKMYKIIAEEAVESVNSNLLI